MIRLLVATLLLLPSLALAQTGVLSGGSVTATGGSTSRSLADWFQGMDKSGTEFIFSPSAAPAIQIGPTTTTTGDPPAYVQLQQTVNNTALGTVGNVASTLRVQANVSGSPNNFIWGINSVINDTGTGIGEQDVALSGSAFKTAGNRHIWALFGQSADETGSPSSVSGLTTGAEIDLDANAADDAASRSILSLDFNKFDSGGTDATSRNGLLLSSNTGTSIQSMVRLLGHYSTAGLDLTGATEDSGHGVWLKTNQTIGLDTAGTSSASLSSISSSGTGLFVTMSGVGLQIANTASAVNGILFTPSATGTDPSIKPYGDTNRNLLLAGAGTGKVLFQSNVNSGVGSTSFLLLNGSNSALPSILTGGTAANLVLATSGAVTTTASTGFPVIPTSAGTPTGSAPAGAIVADTTDSKICVSMGSGTWHCI